MALFREIPPQMPKMIAAAIFGTVGSGYIRLLIPPSPILTLREGGIKSKGGLKCELPGLHVFEAILTHRTTNPVAVLQRYIALDYPKITTVCARECLHTLLTLPNRTATCYMPWCFPDCQILSGVGLFFLRRKKIG